MNADIGAHPTASRGSLPGRPELRPRDPGAWIRQIAAGLDAIPTIPAGRLKFGAFVPWFDPDRAPPEWSRVPAAWTAVRARLDLALPCGGEPRFIHRDFHPGNLLLHRGRFSGIVDWTQASVGPPEVDVSRTRVEIAMLSDRAIADEFLQHTECAATYDPLWDALVACELGPWSHDMLAFNDLGARLTLEGVRATSNRRGRIVRIPLAITRLAAFGGDAAGILFGTRALINSRRYAELASEGFVCRVDRLRDRLGIVAEIGLTEGLADASTWYRREGWL